MWLYFDKTGRLLENLEHGSPARAGTTDFEIFAYFEGVDTTAFNTASLKLIKPDLTSSSYPLLLMNRTTKTFELEEGEHANKFKNNEEYTGFYFNFATYLGLNDVTILLDTPGLWNAVISLYGGDNVISVQGLTSFNVQDGVSSEEGNTVSWDEIINSISSQLALKSNISDVIITVPDITSADFTNYAEGQIFYGKLQNKFYRRTLVSPYYELFELDYVSKTSGLKKLYGTDGSGLQTALNYSDSVQNGAIVQRTESGQIVVPTTPSSDNDAASKSFVLSQIASSEADIDVELAKKVDKVSTGFKIYGTDELGAQTTYGVDEFYDGVMVRRDENGRIYTNANIPSDGAQNLAASKKYVDDSIATALTSALTFKGDSTVSGINALGSSATVGDVYNMTDSGTITLGNLQVEAGDNIIWEGTAWDKLSGVDTSAFVLKTTTIAGISLASNISASALTDALVYMNNTTDLDYVMDEQGE